jgi:hypothetical protein
VVRTTPVDEDSWSDMSSSRIGYDTDTDSIQADKKQVRTVAAYLLWRLLMGRFRYYHPGRVANNDTL